MRINTNISAMNAHRQLGVNQGHSSKSLERLSSGLRINRAGDDAAGLAISEKMRSQIRGLNQATRNAQDGISLIQTAEGALNESHAILQRMRELAVQAATDTNTPEDRAELQREVDQLAAELSRIGDTTEFNGMGLLDGTLQNTTFHIGANANQTMGLAINDMRAEALAVGGGNAGLQLEDLAVATGADTGPGHVDIVNGTYTIEALDKTETIAAAAIPVAADAEIGYVLRNDSGEIVAALDTDGRNLFFADNDEGAAAFGDVTWQDTANQYVDFGAGISVSGEITIAVGADGDALTATASNAVVEFTGDTTIASGTYKVVDDDHNLVASGDFGIVDGSGNLVAYSADGTAWETIAGDGLFSYDLTGEVGEDIVIGGDGGIDISSQTAANVALGVIDTAIEAVSSQRSELGAMQNRLEHTISNLGTSAENMAAAESRIRDVDMAAEMMEFTKTNILNQAATAMLAQANLAPQTVLQLLG